MILENKKSMKVEFDKNEYAVLGRVVLKDEVVNDGAVVVAGNRIKHAGRRDGLQLPSHVYDTKGKIVGPGFVDIHCHGGREQAHESPENMAKYHLDHGTTGLLCSLYRDLGYAGTMEAINKIKESMKSCENILGVHMEGPYLNPKYGAGYREAYLIKPCKEKYGKIIESGIVKQWTFSPEVDGTDEFLENITAAGIVPAIGHSEASPERVREVCEKGARVVTHIFNATGCSIFPTRHEGTLEVSFDQAAMLCDNVYYEVICDKNGIHVRYDMIKLLIKTVGIDKVVAITDCAKGQDGDDKENDGSDVNLDDNGDLAGSKLTMLKVAQNFLKLGLSIPDVFRVTSYNPSCAIGVDNIMGSLEPGKLANIIIVDNDFRSVQLLR
jgi:N-acetylglucosamine-6-phosphate deacetylase